jgi:phosphoglycerate dehydrogenase-like enzyme
VTSAYAANAVPVAEYTLATILFSLKHGWALSRQTVEERRFPSRDGAPGCYGSVVGLISMGMIARTLVKLLAPFDLKLLAYDPFLSEREAEELGVERVSLHEVFRRSQVVSLHSPLFAETEGFITDELLASMGSGATFINTARGQLVREQELIDVLLRRPDLHAVLDVAQDEPPAVTSPLYKLSNVTLTPHIAGSVGAECRRLGRYIMEELKRYVSGQPLRWVVTPELAFRSSHRPQGMTSVAGLKIKVPTAVGGFTPLIAANGSDHRAAAPA